MVELTRGSTPPQSETQMTKQVVAQVILKARDGSSVLDAEGPITPELAAKYDVGAARVQQAAELLSTYGFAVTTTGPYSLSISGNREAFERVFETRLVARRLEGPDTGGAAHPTTFYSAADPIAIPAELGSLVAAVTLPTPPELFP